MFWINQVGHGKVKIQLYLIIFCISQDIIVPEAEWKEVEAKAIRASQASKRNIDISSRV